MSRTGLIIGIVLFVTSCHAFAPNGGGFPGGLNPPQNNATHSPQWYSQQEEENNQEICRASEHHVVDKEGVCSCEDGWTGYPTCSLLGPIDNCVSVRQGAYTRTTCVELHPFLCSEQMSVSWVMTVENEYEPTTDTSSLTMFAGVVSLDPKFDTQAVCAYSDVDLGTFSIEQTVNVEYCLHVTDIAVIDSMVYANVTFVQEQFMSRVSIASSSIDFGMLSTPATSCGSVDYVALPCDYEPAPDTFQAAPGSSMDSEILLDRNNSCIYVTSARLVYPLCCASVLMYTCADDPYAVATCSEGLDVMFALDEPETGEDTVQESCSTIEGLEVCLGVTDYRIDADKDSHRGASGNYRVRVTIPNGNRTEYDLGSFQTTFPMCGHDCRYEPGVNGWVAFLWVVGMNIVTVGGFLAILAAAHFGYLRWKQSKTGSTQGDTDLAMVSLLDDSLDLEGQELELVEEEEDDLLG